MMRKVRKMVSSDEVRAAAKKLRSLLGKTQAEFARDIGKSIPTVQRYEGLVPPAGEALVQFMKLADVHGLLDLAAIFQRAISKELGHQIPRFRFRKILRSRSFQANAQSSGSCQHPEIPVQSARANGNGSVSKSRRRERGVMTPTPQRCLSFVPKSAGGLRRASRIRRLFLSCRPGASDDPDAGR